MSVVAGNRYAVGEEITRKLVVEKKIGNSLQLQQLPEIKDCDAGFALLFARAYTKWTIWPARI